MKIHFSLLAVSLCFLFTIFPLVNSHAKDTSNSIIKSLTEKYKAADLKCRGEASEDPKNIEYCDQRDLLEKQLTDKGWCVGGGWREDEIKGWHKCGKDKTQTNNEHLIKKEPPKPKELAPSVAKNIAEEQAQSAREKYERCDQIANLYQVAAGYRDDMQPPESTKKQLIIAVKKVPWVTEDMIITIVNNCYFDPSFRGARGYQLYQVLLAICTTGKNPYEMKPLKHTYEH